MTATSCGAQLHNIPLVTCVSHWTKQQKNVLFSRWTSPVVRLSTVFFLTDKRAAIVYAKKSFAVRTFQPPCDVSATLLTNYKEGGSLKHKVEVTRCNADVILDRFRQCVAECECYAVDQEMTGISIAGVKEHAGMDLSELYPPRRAAATRYNAFQFGVALFTRVPSGQSEEETPTYIVRPFNFTFVATWTTTMWFSISPL